MLGFFFFQAEDGIRDGTVTGVQTCALPILVGSHPGKSLLKVAAVHLFFASLSSKLASLSPRLAPQRALCNWANRFGSKAWPRSHIIHIVSKILRWVLSRAWRTLPVRCRLCW